MTTDPPVPPLRDARIGVHRFSDRLVGRPADDVLRTDVTEALASALRGWLHRVNNRSLEGQEAVNRAAARLDIPASSPPHFINVNGFELLDVTDQVIDLIVPDITHSGSAMTSKILRDDLAELSTILADHRSLYTVGEVDRPSGFGLVTRVDPTVQEAFVKVVEDSTGYAGRHLAAAWSALHQLTPDPDFAYKEAVRAIEAALGPIVLPQAQSPTVGQIKNSLQNRTRWASVLDRTGPAGKPPAIAEASNSSVVFIVDLLERIYGTQARHGDNREHREQTTAQAAAAVYAAVAILGWAQNGTFVQTPGG